VRTLAWSDVSGAFDFPDPLAVVALERHNRAIKTIRCERKARGDRDGALDLVDACWEQLTSASAWLAAHHSYVLAVDAARRAIETWKRAAEVAAADLAHLYPADGGVCVGYEPVRIADRIPRDPDLEMEWICDREASLRKELETTDAKRRALAAQTLALVR
jgi:hypothetical protein